MTRRTVLIGLWFGGAVLLLVALFAVFGTSPLLVVDAIVHAPPLLFLVVTGLTISNLITATLKWRISMTYFSPDSTSVNFYQGFEATALGAIFGQIVPVQLATAATRSLLISRDGVVARRAVGTTLHEQLFDFLVLLTIGVAGLLVLFTGMSAPTIIFVGATFALICILSLGVTFRFAGSICQLLVRIGRHRMQHSVISLQKAFVHAAEAPHSVTLRLMFLSFLKLVFIIGRAIAVALVFAPSAAPLLVAAGFPAVALIGLIPFTPAGIGVVEWSWGGVLTAAGAPLEQAAIAAVSFRIVNLIAVSAVIAGLGVLRFLIR